MNTFSYLTNLLLGILAVLGQYCVAVPQERILDGTPIDTLRRFPHYVTIQTAGQQLCGGSIISDQWILTAMHCVPDGGFSIHFHMKNLHQSNEGFSLLLSDSSVIRYPTGYDNIALIKLPVILKFSDDLAPISFEDIDDDYNGKDNGFVVLPGLSPNQNDALTYGMFKLLPAQQCSKRSTSDSEARDTWFDPYLEICTMGWNNNKQMPCQGNEGSGLVFGWPRQPRLIGIFSSPEQCISGTPAIYVKLSAYVSWIRQTIKN